MMVNHGFRIRRLSDSHTQLLTIAPCENQAFVYGDRVLGLQFHLETTQETLEALVHGCANELTADRPFIQSPGQMLSDPHRFTRLNQILNPILKELSARVS